VLRARVGQSGAAVGPLWRGRRGFAKTHPEHGLHSSSRSCRRSGDRTDQRLTVRPIVLDPAAQGTVQDNVAMKRAAFAAAVSR